MANTKFLDYNGLSKLVEKIKNTYLNLGGGTMSGTITTVKDSKPAIDFRGPHNSYGATINYDTAGNEALAVNLQQATTSFMVNSGTNGKTWTGSGKYSTVTPTLQVKGKYVSINKFIPDNTTPTHTLEVNGSVKATSFDGTTFTGNASSASKLGTSTIGNTTTPIYLNNGTPNACTHSLNADVPANAKFTDTTYNIYQNPRINNSFWVIENDNSDTAQEIIINDVEHASKADSINVNDTPIGDVTTPVYINSSGKPTAISYSINANVPSGAKFTDTWRPLGNTADTACAGNDSRLSNSRPASDVYAWAKAATKPKYTKDEVGLENVDNTHDKDKDVRSALTATSAQYAYQTMINGTGQDLVYDFIEGGNHYIRCGSANIIRKNGKNFNNYDFVLNPDGKGGIYIYDGPNAKGAFWGIDGITFEKAPANSIVAADGTFITAITNTEIQNEIDKAITL